MADTVAIDIIDCEEIVYDDEGQIHVITHKGNDGNDHNKRVAITYLATAPSVSNARWLCSHIARILKRVDELREHGADMRLQNMKLEKKWQHAEQERDKLRREIKKAKG